MAKSKAAAKSSKGKATKTAKKGKPAAKAAPKKASPKKGTPAAKAAPKKGTKAAPKKGTKAAPTKAAPSKAAPKKAAKAAPAKAKSPAQAAADAYKDAIAAAVGPKSAGTGALGTLRLDNYRRPFAATLDALSEAEKTQLAAVVGADTLPTLFGASIDDNEMSMLEYIDVVDTKTGAIVANLLIWPYGDGAVVHHGTTKMIASIVQHGIEPHETTGKAWMDDFAKAWAEGASRLGVFDPNHFGFSTEQTSDDDDD